MLIFGFLANIVLMRLLPSDAFGIIALASFFVQLFRLQPKIGLGYAFVQQKDLSARMLQTYIPLELILAFGGLGLTIIVAPLLTRFGYSAEIAYFTLALSGAMFFEGLAGIAMLILESDYRFPQTSLMQSVLLPLSYIPAIALAAATHSAWSLVAQPLLYNVSFAFTGWFLVWRYVPQVRHLRWKMDRLITRRLLGFGTKVGLGAFAASLLTTLDNFFIGTFVGTATLGYYDRAYRTAQQPATLLNSVISRTVFVTYTKLQGDTERLQKTLNIVLWLIAVSTIPLALAIFASAPDLLVLLYGPQWLPSAIFLRILVIYSVTRPLWENGGSFLVAIGRPGLTTSITAVQLIALAVTGLPLTLLWGALGTCIAVGISFAIGIAMLYRQIHRAVAFSVFAVFKVPLLAAALSLLGYLALIFLVDLNTLPLVLRVAIKSGFVVAAFFAILLAVQFRSTKERVNYLRRLVHPPTG